MKRVLTAIICLMAITLTHAQESASHIKFWGVEVNGPVKDFVKQMAAKGLKYNTKMDKVTLMTGEIKGYKDCSVFIQECDAKDLVYTVGVTFAQQATWDSLLINYSQIKAALTETYGKPTKNVEKFAGKDSLPTTAAQKLQLVKDGKCDYYTEYELPEGTITLEIATAHYTEETLCYVMLEFIDKENLKLQTTTTKMPALKAPEFK